MISLRHHIVSLIAVFLALAVGIVLGGGPLADLARPIAPTAPVPTESTTTEAEAAYGERFASAAAASLYADRLANQRVAVVTFPGVDEAVVTAVSEQIEAAGGSLTARWALGELLTDPTQRTLAETLGSQVAAALPPGTVAADATTYDRLGQLLGLTASVKPGVAKLERSKVRSVAEALARAELVQTDQPDPSRGARLVLVLLGDDLRDSAGTAITTGLLTGLSQAAPAVVVAGTAADADPGAQLADVRDAQVPVASVDSVETTMGQVAAVLALARSVSTPGGSFGASGSDGALPLG